MSIDGIENKKRAAYPGSRFQAISICPTPTKISHSQFFLQYSLVTGGTTMTIPVVFFH